MSRWRKPLKDFVKKKCKGILTISISSGGQYRRQKKILELSRRLCYSLDKERRLLVTDATRELPIDG